MSLELERLESAARLRDDLEGLRADLRDRGLVVDTPKGPAPNPSVLRVQSGERLLTATLAKLQVTRPEPKTGQLSRAQRNRLRDLDAGRRRAS